MTVERSTSQSSSSPSQSSSPSPSQSPSSTKRGFSILEALFAGSILILGLAGVASTYSGASAAFAHQRDSARAIAIAESFLEQVVLLPPTSPLLTAGAHDARHFDVDGGVDAPENEAHFAMDWTVTANVPTPGMKEVVVVVRWKRDRDHQIRLFTYRE